MKLAILTFSAIAVAFAQAPATDATAPVVKGHKEAKKHKKHVKKADAAKPAAAVTPAAK